MAVVTFNPAMFYARYPMFSNVALSLLQACFEEAGLYLDNTNCSPVRNVGRRAILLNMLVAHIAFLGGALSTDGQARPVGRVSQATEGSVSASFDMGAPATGSKAWYDQTPWGAAFYQATLNLRSFHYVPQPTDPYSQNNFTRWGITPSGYPRNR